MRYSVEVYDMDDDDLVVRILGPYDSRIQAERVEKALDVKINHARFYCAVTQSE